MLYIYAYIIIIIIILLLLLFWLQSIIYLFNPVKRLLGGIRYVAIFYNNVKEY